MGWISNSKAKRTIVAGISFPSKLEAAVFLLHKQLEHSGEISDLRMQASVVVKSRCEHCGDGPVVWKVDFSYLNKKGELEYAEAKGIETPSYRKRKKLWKQSPPGRLTI